jgi:hypothetical protein
VPSAPGSSRPPAPTSTPTPHPAWEPAPAPTKWDSAALLLAYLKTNRDYYLEKFTKSEGWNGAAFALGGLWYFYRKMVVPGIIFEVCLMIIFLISSAVPFLGLFLWIPLGFMQGLLANTTYKKRINSEIEKMRGRPYNEALLYFQKKPDTSSLLPICAGIVYLIIGTALREPFIAFVASLVY